MAIVKLYEPGTRFPKSPFMEYLHFDGWYIEPKTGFKHQMAVFKCHVDDCEKQTRPVIIGDVKTGKTKSCGNHLFSTYEVGHIFKRSPKLSWARSAGFWIDKKSGMKKQLGIFICKIEGCEKETKPIRVNDVQSGGIVSCGLHQNVTQHLIFNVFKESCFDAIEEFRIPETMLRVDMISHTLKIAIEYDGRQHWQLMGHDNGDVSRLDRQKECDKRKDKWLKSNGYKLLRIPENKYYRNSEKYKTIIEDFVKEAQLNGQ